MAKFVESAVMRVIDQSSKRLNTIEKTMRGVRKETEALKKLSGFKFKADINVKKINQAAKAIDKLNAAMGKSKPMAGNTAGINSTIQALKRLQRQINATNKSANVKVNMTGGSGRGGRMGGNGTYRFNISALDAWAAGFIYRLGHTIETSITAGFAKGTRSLDIAQNRLLELSLNENDQRKVRAGAQDIVRQFPVLSQADAVNLVGDSLPSTRGNIDSALAAVKMLAENITAQVRRGVDPARAIDDSINLIKAAEQSGNVTNDDGTFNVTKARAFFDVINKAFIESGADMSANLIRNFTKSLRTAKFSLNEEGWATGLLLAEEQGSTAGVGLNQLIKQLSGERIMKKQLANLMEMGLVTGKDVKAGKVGDVDLMELVGGGAVDEDTLRQNTLQWITEKVLPRMREMGLNPDNGSDVSKFAGLITSDRTATEALSALIKRGDELTLQVKQFLARDVSQETEQQRNAASSLLAYHSALNQITSAMGQFGHSLESISIPVLNGIAEAFRNLSNYLGADEGGPTRSIMTGGAIGAGALGAGYVGKTAFDWFRGSAAVNLNTTATERNTLALAALTASMGGSGIPGVPTPGGKNKAPNKSIGMTATALLSMAGLGWLYETVKDGKKTIEDTTNPLNAKEAEANARNTKNLEAIKDAISKFVGAIPSANQTMPEGTQTQGWRESLNKFLWGDAASPDFNGKDAFGIEIGASRLSEAFNEGSELARGKIAESGSQLGSNAATSLLAIGSQLGATIGQSMQANFNPGSVPVTVTTQSGPNTGNNPNNAR